MRNKKSVNKDFDILIWFSNIYTTWNSIKDFIVKLNDDWNDSQEEDGKCQEVSDFLKCSWNVLSQVSSS